MLLTASADHRVGYIEENPGTGCIDQDVILVLTAVCI